jgi:hypothetical protein
MEVSCMVSMERERAYGKKKSAQVLRCCRSPTTTETGSRPGWGQDSIDERDRPAMGGNPEFVARDQPNR